MKHVYVWTLLSNILVALWKTATPPVSVKMQHDVNFRSKNQREAA